MHIVANLLRKKENKFDHIISLGYNCEIMFRFLLYFKFEESSLFNWVGILSIDHLIDVLNNFDKIGTGGLKNPNPLYECINSKIRFHGKVFNTNEDSDKSIIEQDKKDLTQRIEYLKNKFLKIAQDSSSKLYICKLKDEDVNIEKMDSLYNILKNMGFNNFKLLFVCQENALNVDCSDKPYMVRTVKYFASDLDVTNKKYLKNGWDKIFDEFSCISIKKPKIKKTYKFEKRK